MFKESQMKQSDDRFSKKIQRPGIKVGSSLIHGLSIGQECCLHDFYNQCFCGGKRTFFDSLYYCIDKGS